MHIRAWNDHPLGIFASFDGTHIKEAFDLLI
ncbi:Uncharacterised protein [Vibrio cholerae]|nr:Uncharacterised protein [Vibrio cholerae]CSC44655.1 Uncharacterised protein [Vibrio cholerae]